MRHVPSARVALLLALAAAAAGCHRGGAQAAVLRANSASESDTGIVRVVGVEAAASVVLELDGGRPSLTLDGPAALRRVDGLRISVTGERAGARLTVRSFAVLSANGVAAVDGMLAKDGDATVLVTLDGVRHRLVNPPPLLRENAGHRAWVSGPLDREVVAFGIIQ